MNNDEKLSDITSKTPFHLDSAWELLIENRNKSCSHSEIDKLIQNRIINLIDVEIIKILAVYPFINSNCITFLLNKNLHPGYQKVSYLNNLNKLKKAGVVLRYFPVEPNTASNSTEPSSHSPVAPLRLYALSQPAYTYIAPLTEDSHKISVVSSLHKIELASLNQFLAHFQVLYSNKIKYTEYQKKSKIGSTAFRIDAVVHCHSKHPVFEFTDQISLYVLSVREYGNWLKNIITRLKILRIWLERRQDDFSVPFVLLLIENLSMSLSIFSQMQDVSVLEGFPVYFCPDVLLMQYPPLDSIYSCEVSKDGRLTAIRHSICL